LTASGTLNNMASTGYQPLTLQRLAEHLAAREAGTDELRWRLVAEFFEEFQNEPESTRGELIKADPDTTADKRFDVLLGAIAEHLAYHHNLPVPKWAITEDRLWMGTAWFPNNLPSARVWALAHSPAAFRRRGIFIHPDDLGRA
jgi:hypothetical protein